MKDIQPVENLWHLSPKVLFQNTWKKKPEGNWLTQVQTENGN